MTTRFLAPATAKSPFLLVLVIGFLSWLVAAAFELVIPLHTLELKTLDWRFVLGAHPQEADTNVVIVAIDQNSLDFYERQEVGWPWPREFYGLLLDYLSAGGARVVAFDIDFSSRSPDRLEMDGEESDSTFGAAILKAHNVILPAFLSTREQQDQPGDSILPRLLIPNAGRALQLQVKDRATAPRQVFQQSLERLCVANYESDPDDISRRAPMVYRFRHGCLPHFALACYMQARSVRGSAMDSLLATLPLDQAGQFQIGWYGKGGPDGAFRYYSIHALLHSAQKMLTGKPADLDPRIFHNKCVIVGGSAQGLYDYKPTPFTAFEPYPGMEIHATILSNLLRGHFLRQYAPLANTIPGLILGLTVPLLFLRMKKIPVAVAAIGGVVLLYVALAFGAFTVFRTWIPMAGPVSAMIFAFASTAVISYATEGRQRRKLRKAFDRYLSPHVVTEILDHADQLELGGKLIEGTVYFSDIKGFTSISEHYAPRDLVALLNEYFSLASDLIMKNDAMLDKYIGDAVMAIFGAPVQRPDHARVACLTALEVQRVLDEFYGRAEASGVPRFVTRIGLNSGRMIVGNIGHTKRLDYTAIGDTVNLASRLEGVNKVFGTRIIISESTLRLSGGAVEVRELDLIRVKGKQEAIRIYELVAGRGDLTPAAREKFALFHEGIILYRSRKFEKAAEQFRKVLAGTPDDGPAQTYIERCTELSRATLPEEWDGVYTMETK